MELSRDVETASPLPDPSLSSSEWMRPRNLKPGAYLHDRKSEMARMGGLVTAIGPAEEPGFTDQGRYVITFEPRAEAKRMRWRGAKHTMAWTGGVIEADAPHEV